jgi:hypothetical protein
MAIFIFYLPSKSVAHPARAWQQENPGAPLAKSSFSATGTRKLLYNHDANLV